MTVLVELVLFFPHLLKFGHIFHKKISVENQGTGTVWERWGNSVDGHGGKILLDLVKKRLQFLSIS